MSGRLGRAALRDQIAERLRAAGWEPCTTRAKHGGGHSYRDGCAICAGDIDGITGVLMAVLNPEIEQLEFALASQIGLYRSAEEDLDRAEAALQRVRRALDDGDYGGPERGEVIAEIRAALDQPAKD